MMEILILMGIGFLVAYSAKKQAETIPALSTQTTSSQKAVVIPEEKKPSALESPAIKGMIGTGIKMGADLLTSGDLVPSNWSPGIGMVSVLSTALSGQSDFSNPYSSISESVINSIFPVLGTVIGGFIEGMIGKDPKWGVMAYNWVYDSKTRSFKKGTLPVSPYSDIYGIRQQGEIIQNKMIEIVLDNEKLSPSYQVSIQNDPIKLNDLSRRMGIYFIDESGQAGSSYTSGQIQAFYDAGLRWEGMGSIYGMVLDLSELKTDPYGLKSFEVLMNADELNWYDKVYVPVEVYLRNQPAPLS